MTFWSPWGWWSGYSALALGGGGTPASSLAPIGSSIGVIGDGVCSDGAAASVRNAPLWMLTYLNARVLPTTVYNWCISGDSLAGELARSTGFAATMPDIAVLLPDGHNDNLKSTDPDITPTILDEWKDLKDAQIAALIAANPSIYKIIICSALPSGLAGEVVASSFNGAITIRDRVIDLQEAYVTALADDRIVFKDLSAFVPTTMTPTSDANRVHPDERGGYWIGFEQLGPFVGQYIEAATKDEILDLLTAGTYPGLGANLDPDVLLAGSGGTKAGAQSALITGNVPTGKRVTNTLANGTGVEIACSQVVVGSYNLFDMWIKGTPGAQNTMTIDDSAAVSLTGSTPGQFAFAIMPIKMSASGGGAPVGLHNFGNAGTAYMWGSTGSMGTGVTADIAHEIDTIIPLLPRVFFGGSGPFNFFPGSLTVRMSIAAMDNVLEYERPVVAVPSNRTKGDMWYLGAVGILTANYVLRITGTTTLRIEPGTWNLYGLTEADFAERRIYKDGGSGGVAGLSNLGAGTLMFTASGSTWIWVHAGAIVSGDNLYVEITDRDGHVFRSNAAFVYP